MIRTQVYLTEEERDGLLSIARLTNRKQAELIRAAVDRFLDLARGQGKEAILHEAGGLWRDRDDLPDIGDLRTSWNRG